MKKYSAFSLVKESSDDSLIQTPFLLIEDIHPIGRGKTNDLNGSILKGLPFFGSASVDLCRNWRHCDKCQAKVPQQCTSTSPRGPLGRPRASRKSVTGTSSRPGCPQRARKGLSCTPWFAEKCQEMRTSRNPIIYYLSGMLSTHNEL